MNSFTSFCELYVVLCQLGFAVVLASFVVFSLCFAFVSWLLSVLRVGNARCDRGKQQTEDAASAGVFVSLVSRTWVLAPSFARSFAVFNLLYLPTMISL